MDDCNEEPNIAVTSDGSHFDAVLPLQSVKLEHAHREPEAEHHQDVSLLESIDGSSLHNGDTASPGGLDSLQPADNQSSEAPPAFVDIDFVSADSEATVEVSDESGPENDSGSHRVDSKDDQDTSALSDCKASRTDDLAVEVLSDGSDDSPRLRNGATARSPPRKAFADATGCGGKLEETLEGQPVSLEQSESQSSDVVLGRTSDSTPASSEGEGRERKSSKSSIYEKKQIDAPVVHQGDRINTRKQNLLEQYEKDMLGRDGENDGAEEPVRGKVSQLKNTFGVSDEDERMQSLRLEKERELEEVRRAFQERSSEQVEDRAETSTKSEEIKARKSFGSLKDRYMAVAHGQKAKDSDDSDDEQDDTNGEIVVDGKSVVKSSGKVDEVRSGESIGNILSAFQNRSEFQAKSAGSAADVVDSEVISSARSKFKTMEAKKDEAQDFQRPTQRRVQDPKQVMEARQKATYGEEEIVQDGAVRKTVNIEEEMTSAAKEAHAAYKQLVEKKEEPTSPVRKPASRLMSDSDARATLEQKRHATEENGGVGDPDAASPNHGMANGAVRFEIPGSEMV